MKNYLGIDWGGRNDLNDKDKPTVVVILSKEDEKYELKRIQNIGFSDYEYKIEEIVKIVNKEKAEVTVADWSYGQYQVQKLQQKFGQRVASCYYSANEEDFKYSSDTWMITANRDRNMAKALKKIGYPFSMHLKWECLATDQDFHALNFAYLASRLDKMKSKKSHT